MSAKITVIFPVRPGYSQGDYAMLYTNGGIGNVDYSEPIDDTAYELFPDGAGIFGYGFGAYGHFPYGRGDVRKTDGYGHLPYGYTPYGFAGVFIPAETIVESCGEYRFGFKVYDSVGNLQIGNQHDAVISVHIAPPQPTGLKKNNYNKDTHILVLNTI
jgi:hypothetical protein